MITPHRNLELKIRCPDIAKVRKIVENLGAPFAGIETQTDTYFLAPNGRLKLREIENSQAVLIAYHRPDTEGVRLSAYHLVPVSDPAGLKAALAAALGIRGVVHKRREIYLWHNVRIHLDEVTELGSFLEFEAVISETADGDISLVRLDRLCQALSINREAGIPRSYADLIGIEA